MTIAELCLFAAVVLTILAVMPAKIDGRRKGEFDNANPRNPAFYAAGLRARAQGAHQNSFEVFPFFAAAVLLAEMRSVPQGTVNALALAFVAARIIYVLCYLGDRPTARSITFSVGTAINIALFFSPAWAR
jgi:uncharacterized MAPEG superfamily protein